MELEKVEPEKIIKEEEAPKKPTNTKKSQSNHKNTNTSHPEKG